MIPVAAPLSFALSDLEAYAKSEVVYYAVSALVFLLAGLVAGYFIWRKGHMQTLDAETEIRRTADDLAKLRDDLRTEAAGLGDDLPGSAGTDAAR